ncbi:YqzG/YhdC family protein [Rossellomorea aquimaris]|uniref:DUF3889 domain-containing protein n=1 Tax=Rossellomorea aquimaris TaxID=189382 RepID=UPI001CD3E0E9|nr:DUF3889 domain-containing protein [Rossellomorea aquimaris]MCA1056544.1 YqzG/YhdC family protein [Rossellomorea aquimaris]
MKHVIMLVTALFCLNFTAAVHAEQPQPSDYAKFGRIATAVIKEDYPGQALKDYKYQGRQKIDEGKLADNFEFTVQDNGKEKKVIVKVIHDLDNEKILNIAVNEQP